ncbi:MAG: phenylpropionate dioxygenase-like ring-hydroxylating dioxygenase large terminal subunit [Parasphingorhabdus sp.]|jgi:phenylpropionate dioxygenase-like ring-hydroxylating dioxygenase large terminal subunit
MPKLQRAKEDWYPICIEGGLQVGEVRQTHLLGEDLVLKGEKNNNVSVTAAGESKLVQTAYNHIWTSLSDSPRQLFSIAEAAETDRTFVPCGIVRVKCSPLRAVENFLDIAHFPFIHTDVLGAEPHTEVVEYDVEINEEANEVLATNVKFYQPQAAMSAGEGIITDYIYRVPAPMVSILYKSCPPKPEALDVIALFVQPLDEESCNVWPWMALYDYENSMADLISFQQMIFLQDRSILENQRPVKLPLDRSAEMPSRADRTSLVYRRWLKKQGATYGAITEES